MRGSVPIAEIMNAQQRKAQMEQEAKNQSLKNMLEMLNSGVQAAQLVNQTRQVGLAKDELAIKQQQQQAEKDAAIARAQMFADSQYPDEPTIGEGAVAGQDGVVNRSAFAKRDLANLMARAGQGKDSMDFMKMALPTSTVVKNMQSGETFESTTPGFFTKKVIPYKPPSPGSGGSKEDTPEQIRIKIAQQTEDDLNKEFPDFNQYGTATPDQIATHERRKLQLSLINEAKIQHADKYLDFETDLAGAINEARKNGNNPVLIDEYIKALRIGYPKLAGRINRSLFDPPAPQAAPKRGIWPFNR